MSFLLSFAARASAGDRVHHCSAPPTSDEAQRLHAGWGVFGAVNESTEFACSAALSNLVHATCSTMYAAAAARMAAPLDYCSGPANKLPCVVSGNHSAWPTHALLGSQLTRRLDAIKAAYAHGCSYAHVPLAQPVTWAEEHFRLGHRCRQAPPAFTKPWERVDRKFVLRGARNAAPLAGSVLLPLRGRLLPKSTPWFGDGAGGSSADELQVVVHMRRGDLARHRLESDQSRWVPDEYYEEVLPRLVSALAQAAPVVLHLVSELAPGWSGAASAHWQALLCAAGARRVALHLGAPWPANWSSTQLINENILQTFQHMADADVLLTAVSGFSKAAASYSAGLVLHISGVPKVACRADCPPQLPAPPRCTASTEERLRRVLTEPDHVDFQCCSGRWRNATRRGSHCNAGCLAIGEEQGHTQ